MTTKGADRWEDAPFIGVNETSLPTPNWELTVDTSEPYYSASAPKTAWWKFTATRTGYYRIGKTASRQTISGDKGDISTLRLAVLDANLNGRWWGWDSVISPWLDEGETYYLRVSAPNETTLTWATIDGVFQQVQSRWELRLTVADALPISTEITWSPPLYVTTADAGSGNFLHEPRLLPLGGDNVLGLWHGVDANWSTVYLEGMVFAPDGPVGERYRLWTLTAANYPGPTSTTGDIYTNVNSLSTADLGDGYFVCCMNLAGGTTFMALTLLHADSTTGAVTLVDREIIEGTGADCFLVSSGDGRGILAQCEDGVGTSLRFVSRSGSSLVLGAMTPLPGYSSHTDGVNNMWCNGSVGVVATFMSDPATGAGPIIPFTLNGDVFTFGPAQQASGFASETEWFGYHSRYSPDGQGYWDNGYLVDGPAANQFLSNTTHGGDIESWELGLFETDGQSVWCVQHTDYPGFAEGDGVMFSWNRWLVRGLVQGTPFFLWGVNNGNPTVVYDPFGSPSMTDQMPWDGVYADISLSSGWDNAVAGVSSGFFVALSDEFYTNSSTNWHKGVAVFWFPLAQPASDYMGSRRRFW